MGQLVPFPTTYLPTIQELERLNNIQKEIASWRVELIREWDKRFFNAGERWLSRQAFHHGLRDNWRIYPGFKGQWKEEDSLPLDVPL